VKGLSQRTLA